MVDQLSVSPLAPKGGFPDLPVIGGVRFSTVKAGIRNLSRADLMLAELVPGTTIAGTFTRSQTRSAAVLDCEAKIELASDSGAAIIVNSGNANAFTGVQGVEAVNTISSAVAGLLDLPMGRIFTSSTGVIGEPLPLKKITISLKNLKSGLSKARISDAAQAIMTTDTFSKGSGRTIQIDGKEVRIAGIAKGSGMIAPDMATMLVYIFTDAKVRLDMLQSMTRLICNRTFNCITVDSDTSTSDTLLVAATGTSGVDIDQNPDFFVALSEVMMDLAHQVVRDGEGATKFVTVNVQGAASDADAIRTAFSIANSPLVKTAVAGEDPNWGRVVMAVGKSGAKADRDRLSIWFGDVQVAFNGQVALGYDEASAAQHMMNDEVMIRVDLGLGASAATVYTCDLTSQYIAINADYRS